MSVIGSLAAFDHWLQRVYLIESVPVLMDDEALDRAYDAAMCRVERAVADLARPLAYVPVAPPHADDEMPEVVSTMPNGMYQRAVEVAKEHIVAGDIFQVVLPQRYDIDLEADPFDFYRVLRQINPSPYMYFLRHPDITIVGSSPEPMVQVLGRKVISRPIAGTRRRGRDDDHDRRMAGELKENPKEVAEHIMLVDLARNDVGRIAKFGTVHVDELMTLERYSHVMHLTSQVWRTGRRNDPIDVLRATLPAGTVSGAPKVRAMEIIDALEPVKRGPYAGVVGYVDFSGNLDTAIAIRTMFVGSNGASFRPARVSSPTRYPTTRISSVATRPPRCSPQSPRRAECAGTPTSDPPRSGRRLGAGGSPPRRRDRPSCTRCVTNRPTGRPGNVVEPAYRRREVGIGWFAVDRPVSLVRTGDRARHSIEEHLGVGMLRIGDELVGGRELDDLSEVHHGDRVAEIADDRHVVADEQHRHAERRPGSRAGR